MKEPHYNFKETGMNISRRDFIGVSLLSIGCLSLPLVGCKADNNNIQVEQLESQKTPNCEGSGTSATVSPQSSGIAQSEILNYEDEDGFRYSVFFRMERPMITIDATQGKPGETAIQFFSKGTIESRTWTRGKSKTGWSGFDIYPVFPKAFIGSDSVYKAFGSTTSQEKPLSVGIYTNPFIPDIPSENLYGLGKSPFPQDGSAQVGSLDGVEYGSHQLLLNSNEWIKKNGNETRKSVEGNGESQIITSTWPIGTDAGFSAKTGEYTYGPNSVSVIVPESDAESIKKVLENPVAWVMTIRHRRVGPATNTLDPQAWTELPLGTSALGYIGVANIGFSLNSPEPIVLVLHTSKES
jgi:hypothetical protein